MTNISIKQSTRINRNREVHSFTRTAILSQPVYDYTAPTNFAGNGVASYFQLGQVPGSSEFTSLFDAFRIKCVRMKFIYGQNTQDASATRSIPNIVFVNDYDDGTVLTGLTDYGQYSKVHVHRLDKPFEISFKPLASTAVYNGAFTGYATAAKDMWYDCASSGIQFYGAKWAIDPVVYGAGSTVIGQLSIVIEYDLEFKWPR